MSELDEWFGPKETEMPESRGTKYPRSPEHLRPLLDRFGELVQEQDVAVNKAMRKLWAGSAEDYYNMAGGSVELMESAFRHAMAEKLFIKDLRSLMNIAVNLKMHKKDERGETAADRVQRQKYLEGWE